MKILSRALSSALDILVERFVGIRRKYLPSHFIFGLDEAQQASRMYPRSFISSRDPNTFRSIIREVADLFTNLPIKLIVSGTGLSLEEVQDSMASGVSKANNAVHLFHELGMFDTWRKLESFLKRYIPASTLDSESGRHLKPRMREYLQGR
jgi:hypothetical protein